MWLHHFFNNETCRHVSFINDKIFWDIPTLVLINLVLLKKQQQQQPGSGCFITVNVELKLITGNSFYVKR